MKTFENRDITPDFAKQVIESSPSIHWALAMTAGVFTTKELHAQFLLQELRPDTLKTGCTMLLEHLRKKIEFSDLVASRSRRLGIDPQDVEKERKWLPVIERCAERAAAAENYWHHQRGPEELAQRYARHVAATAAARTPAPQTIELRPTFNIQLRQDENKGPMAVQVVSMPARETTTAITRDADGNIAASTQLEKDAV